MAEADTALEEARKLISRDLRLRRSVAEYAVRTVVNAIGRRLLDRRPVDLPGIGQFSVREKTITRTAQLLGMLATTSPLRQIRYHYVSFDSEEAFTNRLNNRTERSPLQQPKPPPITDLPALTDEDKAEIQSIKELEAIIRKETAAQAVADRRAQREAEQAERLAARAAAQQTETARQAAELEKREAQRQATRAAETERQRAELAVREARRAATTAQETQRQRAAITERATARTEASEARADAQLAAQTTTLPDIPTGTAGTATATKGAEATTTTPPAPAAPVPDPAYAMYAPGDYTGPPPLAGTPAHALTRSIIDLMTRSGWTRGTQPARFVQSNTGTPYLQLPTITHARTLPQLDTATRTWQAITEPWHRFT